MTSFNEVGLWRQLDKLVLETWFKAQKAQSGQGESVEMLDKFVAVVEAHKQPDYTVSMLTKLYTF